MACACGCAAQARIMLPTHVLQAVLSSGIWFEVDFTGLFALRWVGFVLDYQESTTLSRNFYKNVFKLLTVACASNVTSKPGCLEVVVSSASYMPLQLAKTLRAMSEIFALSIAFSIASCTTGIVYHQPEDLKGGNMSSVGHSSSTT